MAGLVSPEVSLLGTQAVPHPAITLCSDSPGFNLQLSQEHTQVGDGPPYWPHLNSVTPLKSCLQMRSHTEALEIRASAYEPGRDGIRL